MQRIIEVLASFDGLATTAELRRHGIDRDRIDIAYMYGRIWRVRKGLWALPTISRPVLAAQRAKGRLACVSALVHHGVIDDAGYDLHVSARHEQVSWHPVPPRAHVIRHWSRQPLAGDRFAVSPEVAWSQFAVCLAVAGREVRLQRTDNL